MMLQLVFAILNFVLVMALIYHFAGPTVAKLLHERHEAHLRAIDEAEAARKQASEKLALHEQRLAGVDGELKAIVQQAQVMAQKVGSDLQASAEADAERLLQLAGGEILRQQLVARREVQRLLTQRSLEEARAALQRQMNPDLQRALVARFVRQLEEGACPIRL